MKYIKMFLPYVIIVVVVVIIRTFIVTPVRVEGTSMYPTLSNGDILLLKKYDKKIDRFDIIVFKYNGEKLVKRVIALPYETIKYENSILYINDEVVEDVVDAKTSDIAKTKVIPKDCYYVMGDNRGNSKDSRYSGIGFVCIDDIIGTTNFRLFWPLQKIK